VIPPENQLAQAENESIEEEVTANEKVIRNDGSDNFGGSLDSNSYLL
jgi:hypothetical protein